MWMIYVLLLASIVSFWVFPNRYKNFRPNPSLMHCKRFSQLTSFLVSAKHKLDNVPRSQIITFSSINIFWHQIIFICNLQAVHRLYIVWYLSRSLVEGYFMKIMFFLSALCRKEEGSKSLSNKDKRSGQPLKHVSLILWVSMFVWFLCLFNVSNVCCTFSVALVKIENAESYLKTFLPISNVVLLPFSIQT